MNLQKATQKSMEALQSAQQLASQNANSQIEQVHLMQADQRKQLLPEVGIGDRLALLHESHPLP